VLGRASFVRGGAFTAGEIEAAMVFASDVKGGRPLVPSAGADDVQQEGHDGYAAYQGSLSHAYRHPVNHTPTLVW
jgi:hypothetical protein